MVSMCTTVARVEPFLGKTNRPPYVLIFVLIFKSLLYVVLCLLIITTFLFAFLLPLKVNYMGLHLFRRDLQVIEIAFEFSFLICCIFFCCLFIFQFQWVLVCLMQRLKHLKTMPKVQMRMALLKLCATSSLLFKFPTP